MRDYKFSFDQLFNFSNSNPYRNISDTNLALFEKLNHLKEKYNFPAINNDIGEFISFLISFSNPKIIFEMGSGYGHSCFWYLQSHTDSIEKIILTERRSDLLEEFNELNWPVNFKSKIDYFVQDAFEVLEKESHIDFALVDGQKSNYLDFLKALMPKMNKGGLVLIDNSYWRGSFLDENLSQTKQSAKNIKDLHLFLKDEKSFTSTFVPYKDGLNILRF